LWHRAVQSDGKEEGLQEHGSKFIKVPCVDWWACRPRGKRGGGVKKGNVQEKVLVIQKMGTELTEGELRAKGTQAGTIIHSHSRINIRRGLDGEKPDGRGGKRSSISGLSLPGETRGQAEQTIEL